MPFSEYLQKEDNMSAAQWELQLRLELLERLVIHSWAGSK